MNFKEPEKEFAISGMIDSFEGDWALVVLKDHQVIRWPKSKLKEDLKEGDSVWLNLSGDKDLTKEREKIARKILEEIINSQEDGK